jgi:hypothetical protein
MPVARLVDLPAIERRAIVYLRLWCHGALGQEEVRQDLAARLGRTRAPDALVRFEGLLRAVARLARRPLARHGLGCACAGTDECAFAGLVACAAEGLADDARLMAGLIAGPVDADGLARAALHAAHDLAADDAPRIDRIRRPSHPAPATAQ